MPQQSFLSLSADAKRHVERAVEDVVRLTDSDSAGLWLVDGDVIRCARHVGMFGGSQEQQYPLIARQLLSVGPLIAGDVSGLMRMFRAGAKLAGARLAEVERTVAEAIEEGLKSVAVVALRAPDGQVLGFLSGSSTNAKHFNKRRVGFLTALAMQLGSAIQSHQRIMQAEKRSAALRTYSEATAMMAGSHDLEKILTTIVEAAVQLGDGTHAAVFLWSDEDHQSLAGVVATADHSPVIRGATVPADSDSAIAEAVRSSSPVTYEDVRAIPCTRPPGQCLACELDVCALIALPLIVNGDPVGALVVSDTAGPRPFNPEQVERLQTLSHQAAATVHHALLHRALEQREAELRVLSDQLVHVHEEERRRIAREVHDVVVQGLAALALEMGLAETQMGECDTDGVHVRCAASSELLTETREVVRRLSDELRPRVLHELGLAAALRAHCREVSRAAQVEVTFQSDVVDVPDAPATALYRAAQEALTNVVRHSGASEVWVNVEQRSGSLMLRVRDNGAGFDSSQRVVDGRPGIGLLGMRERARQLGGKLDVKSTIGVGTRLELEVPL